MPTRCLYMTGCWLWLLHLRRPIFMFFMMLFRRDRGGHRPPWISGWRWVAWYCCWKLPGALGLPLTVVAAVFVAYSLAGPYMPDVISHKGVSLNKLASHQWLGTEGGVFGGVALGGVSTSFVFLFVLFGALLERAGGAGNYFIKVLTPCWGGICAEARPRRRWFPVA